MVEDEPTRTMAADHRTSRQKETTTENNAVAWTYNRNVTCEDVAEKEADLHFGD
jgi:hypothetical protein